MIAAFLAGIVSFLSPCVLPIIPGLIAYLSGVSLTDHHHNRWKMFFNSLAFVLGFSVVFALLGVLLNTFLQEVSIQLQTWLSRIGGILIIIFGLYLLGLFKIGFLESERRLKVKRRFSLTYVTSFVFGSAFAVGWTPCIGPVLGAVLTLAIVSPGKSLFLLLAYALGLGIPFLIVGLFSEWAIGFVKKYKKFLKYFNIVVGVFLIILGILVYTQTLALVANFPLLNDLLLR